MKFTSTVTLVTFFVLSFCVHAQPPTGYYNAAAGKSCADLKTTLQTIISTGSTRSYSALWTQYELTDIKPREVGTGSANVIWDVYSDNPLATDPYNYTPGSDQCGNYSGEGSCYNREHSVPQSWFNSASGPSSDYLHIFPTDGYVNGKRSNNCYGEVATASWTSMNGSKLGSSANAGFTGDVFEPIDSFKGDVARAFLYFVTRYEPNMASWATLTPEGTQALEPNTFPSADIPFLEIMIRWHNLDPVSQKELTRNNGAYSFQQNRNPYIDHPEYVGLVWNNTCPGLSTLPVSITSFRGVLSEDKVKLSWAVENEMNVEKYEVERSLNGALFEPVAEVKAANSRNYFFTDNVERNRGYKISYRLRKVDKDGKFSFSKILALNIPLNTKFNVYPNPATSYIQLHVSSSVKGTILSQLADITGKVLMHETIVAGSNVVRLSTANLATGTYFLKLALNGEQFVQKVIVVK